MLVGEDVLTLGVDWGLGLDMCVINMSGFHLCTFGISWLQGV